MDHIPAWEMPAVGKASRDAVQEAVDVGAWIFGGGMASRTASIVASEFGPDTEQDEMLRQANARP
jgi:hypothetical protein